MAIQISFETYLDEWLSEVRESNPSTVQLGHRFAQKLISQWLEVDDSSDDLLYCDGSGDGGIDAAYLQRGESVDTDTEGSGEGDTWYLIQSKYGRAFQGEGTLLQESRKVIETIVGQQKRLSSLASDLLQRINAFRSRASENDRIKLTFATERPLNDSEKQALDDVRILGRARLGSIFDVDAVSVYTIYQRAIEEDIPTETSVPLKVNIVPSGNDLLVGTVSLIDLYEFLKEFRQQSGDLDKLYEKNVRRFLSLRGRVNKGIQGTLHTEPERFGLYNNGITIVVSDFSDNGDGSVKLSEPYVVNGCQTTRTIWEVCHARLNSGGTGSNPVMDEWRQRAQNGVVVTKIVRVGVTGETLLQSITRFTNTQNAIREKDFLALADDFRTWARQMAEKYNVFLEIQRGGWDSRRALQRQRPNIRQYDKWANAFDLLKVYGAGWLGEAGNAFGRNSAFLPAGTVFKRIMENTSEPLDVDDLFAAYQLQASAARYQFGRGAKASRRQTRFLFYLVIIELLRGIMRQTGIEPTLKGITAALLKLFGNGNRSGIEQLLNDSVQLIDEYMTQGTEDSVFTEPAYMDKFNADLNAYLKSEQLGKAEGTPRLRNLISAYQRVMGRSQSGQPSPREIIAGVITD